MDNRWGREIGQGGEEGRVEQREEATHTEASVIPTGSSGAERTQQGQGPGLCTPAKDCGCEPWMGKFLPWAKLREGRGCEPSAATAPSMRLP